MSKIFILFLMLVLFFSRFNLAYAGVVINEIMYDVEGTDTGREWIEVYNDSDAPVDLSAFKFFEADTNHEIVSAEGNEEVGAYDYAIIALDPVKFKINWPNFGGNIFDSSFSLSNEGESLVVKDSNLNIVDEYTYSSTTGAQGDLKSLQKISSVWESATPTPGKENETSSDASIPDGGDDDYSGGNNSGETEENVSSSSSSNTEKKTKATTAQKIKTQITTKLLAYVGVPHLFGGMAFGEKGEQLFRGKYFWNFGDGDFRELKVVNADKFSHTYFYHGDYAVILEYYSDQFIDTPDASQKVVIKTIVPEILISNVGDDKDFFVELLNNTNYEADISQWILFGNGKSFVLPRNTIISSKKKIIISSKVTNFSTLDKDALKLTTHQGNMVFTYVSSTTPAVSAKTSNEKITKAKTPVDRNQISQKKTTFAATEAKTPEVAISVPEKQVSAVTDDINFGGPASVVKSNIIKDNPTRMYILALISTVFIGVSVGTVYLIRRKKTVPKAGDDFKILDE